MISLKIDARAFPVAWVVALLRFPLPPLYPTNFGALAQVYKVRARCDSQCSQFPVTAVSPQLMHLNFDRFCQNSDASIEFHISDNMNLIAIIVSILYVQVAIASPSGKRKKKSKSKCPSDSDSGSVTCIYDGKKWEACESDSSLECVFDQRFDGKAAKKKTGKGRDKSPVRYLLALCVRMH